MEGADIAFVHLGIAIKHLRNEINIFGFPIAYYGMIIGLGMLVGIWVAQEDAKVREQDPELYLDFALYAIMWFFSGTTTRIICCRFLICGLAVWQFTVV